MGASALQRPPDRREAPGVGAGLVAMGEASADPFDSGAQIVPATQGLSLEQGAGIVQAQEGRPPAATSRANQARSCSGSET